jgi:ABC-2 type transport system permease protein
MNSQTNSLPESFEARVGRPAAISRTQPLYWSLQRELWENRSIYLAPLAVAGLFLLGFVIHTVIVWHHSGLTLPDVIRKQELLVKTYELAAALIMGTAIIVALFYSLDALYGERRDRSILFWKSLPVSDLTTVLSKIIVPIVILPCVSFLVTVAAQFIVLLLTGAMLLGSGASLAALWTQPSFLHMSLIWLYHLLTVHGLWYAPIYGWLIFVSAWAPRAPFIWAFLPPFVVCGLEKIAFNTTHCLALIEYRLNGPQSAGQMGRGSEAMDVTAHLIPHNFFTVPGLWIGLMVGAAFLYAAVRLRRYHGPI